MLNEILILIMSVAGLVVAYRFLIRRVTVREGHLGLYYRKGIYMRQLEAGLHRVYRPNTEVQTVDMRATQMMIQGQEVLSSDNVCLKVSLAVTYRLVNPDAALHSVQSYYSSIYTAAQLALRHVVGEHEMDELLERRALLSSALLAHAVEAAAAIGVEIESIDIKDIMFTGEIKRIYAEVVRARKEGQAALERARGESAALRNLANAAKMLNNNPALMNLRVLQTVSSATVTGGNTLVMGMQQGLMPMGINAADEK